MLWPYDEVKPSRGHDPNEFRISAPWLTLKLQLEGADAARAAALVDKFESGTLAPSDLAEMTWFFRSLSSYPFAYVLPRPQSAFAALESHSLLDERFSQADPSRFFSALTEDLGHEQEFGELAGSPLLKRGWTWDVDASLEFSRVRPDAGHDPYTLLTVARRFHQLDAIQDNRNADVVAAIGALPKGSEAHTWACALLVRQNHFVTQMCDSSLEPALAVARGARAQVEEFRQAERGHDRLLEKAMKTLVADPESVPALASARALMETLRLSASRNLLGFAMVVDIFERSSYHEEEPLSVLLKANGFETAAKQIEVHKKINDAGEHENVSLSFLKRMAPVDAGYAREAMRLAEMATVAIHLLSIELLARVQARAQGATRV